MGTCCLNNEWPPGLCVCVSVCETVHRERKRVAFQGLTFIYGTMSHFSSVTPAVLCGRPRFSSPLFSKMQMDLSAFFVQ